MSEWYKLDDYSQLQLIQSYIRRKKWEFDNQAIFVVNRMFSDNENQANKKKREELALRSLGIDID